MTDVAPTIASTAHARSDAALQAAAGQTWDAVVIGAGPAGATAGAVLARRGWRVLLLERSAWPRQKACGGCLNAAAVALLRQVGLGQVLRGGAWIERARVRVGKRSAEVPIPGGVAIDRMTLDEQLVHAFTEGGGTFIDRVAASLQPDGHDPSLRCISARIGTTSVTLRSRTILACDGLAGTSISDEPWADWRIARQAWIGVAAPAAHLDLDLPLGMIEMNVGAHGYVGLTRYTNDSVHLAAALDPAVCRNAGGPALLIEQILRGCGHTLDVEAMGHLQGTPFLTRQRTGLGGHRVLAVGDACGYVEPFTGEGIAWAFRSAIEATGLLPDPALPWPADLAARWADRHRRVVRRQQHACRAVRYAVRRRPLAIAGVEIIKRWPALAQLINRSPSTTLAEQRPRARAVVA